VVQHEKEDSRYLGSRLAIEEIAENFIEERHETL
jgi:hypothetical protein